MAAWLIVCLRHGAVIRILVEFGTLCASHERATSLVWIDLADTLPQAVRMFSAGCHSMHVSVPQLVAGDL